MIGMKLHHIASGTIGTISAESVHPDGSAVVRINDRWFDARDLTAIQ